MMAASLTGRWVRIEGGADRDETSADRNFCFFLGGGVEPLHVLVRARSLEAAIDLLVTSPAGRLLELSALDSDSFCEWCLRQMALAPGERDFSGCECFYWVTEDGTAAEQLEELEADGEAAAIDDFIRRRDP